jgi:hypothetical protein
LSTVGNLTLTYHRSRCCETCAKTGTGLPLALATAGAYLDQVATSFAEYLRLYETSWLRLQQTSPELESYEDRLFIRRGSFHLTRLNGRTIFQPSFFNYGAYFDNQDLWLEPLKHGDADRSEWLSRVTQDDLAFIHAVRTLCDYRLVEGDKSSQKSEIESRGYSIYSYIHF